MYGDGALLESLFLELGVVEEGFQVSPAALLMVASLRGGEMGDMGRPRMS